MSDNIDNNKSKTLTFNKPLSSDKQAQMFSLVNMVKLKTKNKQVTSTQRSNSTSSRPNLVGHIVDKHNVPTDHTRRLNISATRLAQRAIDQHKSQAQNEQAIGKPQPTIFNNPHDKQRQKMTSQDHHKQMQKMTSQDHHEPVSSQKTQTKEVPKKEKKDRQEMDHEQTVNAHDMSSTAFKQPTSQPSQLDQKT